MEITVNIPKNTYEVPTEIRPEVVQYICDAFLRGCCWSILHPYANGSHRTPTIYVEVRDGKGVGFFNQGYVNSTSAYGLKETFIRFNAQEVKAAFKALIGAGYYMYRYYEFGSWWGYKCYNKPFLQDATRVTEFEDFID